MSLAQPSDPVLSLRGVTKRFPGVIANEAVDLDLYPGETLALLGENGAGKSTLMNIVAGLYRPDEGGVFLRGEELTLNSPRDSAAHRIGMVHQNFTLIEKMTVAENVVLAMEEGPLVPDLRGIAARIRELGEIYGLPVHPEARIWELGVGEQQRVEILKLLYRGADILIFDEPTAVLTPKEADDLHAVIAKMTAEGASAIFITHKMEEVRRFSRRVQVLGKGKTVAVRNTADVTMEELANLMVGRDVLFPLEREEQEPGETRLLLDGVSVTGARGVPALRNVSFTVRAGEILGVAGVAGNGQDELVGSLLGLVQVDSGHIRVNGKETTNKPTGRVLAAGVSFIPPDRMRMGVAGDLSVQHNLGMKRVRKKEYAPGGFIRFRRLRRFAQELIERFRITTPGPDTLIRRLSGGNVQKAIVAREIDAGGTVLIAAYPSRGLDVGAATAVRKHLLAQRRAGAAVLVVSEELDELVAVSDRISVMYDGRIMGEQACGDADFEKIGLMMGGVSPEETEPVGSLSKE